MYPEYEGVFIRLGSLVFALWSQTELNLLPHLPTRLLLLPNPRNTLPCQLPTSNPAYKLLPPPLTLPPCLHVAGVPLSVPSCLTDSLLLS